LSQIDEGLEPDFYAWQCISLSSGERTYDFVIEADKDMNVFLDCVLRIIYENERVK